MFNNHSREMLLYWFSTSLETGDISINDGDIAQQSVNDNNIAMEAEVNERRVSLDDVYKEDKDVIRMTGEVKTLSNKRK